MPGFGRTTRTPPGVKLGLLELIPDRSARNFVLEIGDERFHGFIVRHGDWVKGYVDSCPHAGVTLARKLDDYLTPDQNLITCSWHGALFQIEDGKCIGGPCAGQHLQPWPVEVKQGMITTL